MMNRRRFFQSSLAAAVAYALPTPRLYALDASASQAAGGLAAVKLDGSATIIEQAAVAELKASLRGPLLLAGDAGYDSARRILHPQFDKHPALIVQPTGAADVRNAVTFARERELLLAVKCGGHSFSGKSTCEGGLVIDLQSMQGVRVDPAASRAQVEAGSLLGLLDHETAAFGLATTAGIVSHTGAAGLTLGGGFGRLGRRFGLACDNALAFDVVTADGHYLRASEEENTDLLWGLRGGGGNFGVVTAIDYRLHRMNPMILGGYLGWPIAQARDVMRYYRDTLPSMPEELWIELALLSPEEGPSVAMEVCWTGDPAEGEARLKELRAFGKPAYDDIALIPYVAMQTYSDESLANGKYYYAKNGFLQGLTDDGIDRVLDVFQRDPKLFILFFDPADGAYHRVKPDATAFPHRAAAYWLGLVAAWESADGAEAKIEKIRAAWREIEPLSQGFYSNLSDADTPLSSIRANYGANLERLVALKAKYDPDNLFRLNANVPPKI